MISVEEAIALVTQHAQAKSETEFVSVDKSLGKTLAADLIAPLSLPSFRQSSMDGYALNLHDSNSYSLTGEVKAGDASNPSLQPGEAVRIFTGAKVPDSSNAVVIQERVTKDGDKIILEIQSKIGDNIRQIGEQIAEGITCLPKGHQINASTIGLLKSLGMAEVKVKKSLRAAVVVTGNELVEVGQSLEEGQIYESNSAVIASALSTKGIQDITHIKIKDNLQDTISQLGDALEQNDLLLISGGISVGDYDFVGKALQELKVEQVFYKVLQKPGKPLFFGKRENTYVFALPGNPASTLTCFYIYVNLLIDLISENSDPGLLRVKLPLAADYPNPVGRALFLKAKVKDSKVEILDHQASSTMISFAEANALAYIPTDQKENPAGSLIETILLPYGS
ncbi:molybdopterin molybdotransferase MoeA [Algoriphagus namhaensis]|uniref:Molybdopterin molybdenumtransferase n=1 Tax=Algoriphagus namhaensis TaxID=915353 RepID=A0ABV8AP28_9BACT